MVGGAELLGAGSYQAELFYECGYHAMLHGTLYVIILFEHTLPRVGGWGLGSSAAGLIQTSGYMVPSDYVRYTISQGKHLACYACRAYVC